MNYVTDEIKQPIKDCLKVDEKFNKTFFTFDSLIIVQADVFNTRKNFIGINIEKTPDVKRKGLCSDLKANAELVIAYHCKPDLNTSEDELTVYGLKILKLIETNHEKGILFNAKGIELTNPEMVVGRMWDNPDISKADVISDAAVITYDLQYPF